MSPLGRAVALPLLAASVAAALAAPARAFRGEADSRADAGRFGLDQPEPGARPKTAAPRTPQAVIRLDLLKRAGASIRHTPSGAVAAVMGPVAARGGAPEDAARGFLYDYREALGIDPAALALETLREDELGRHILFRQTHRGLPVEFSRVKMTLTRSGDVLALHSSYRPGIDAAPDPRVPEFAAAQAAARDAGGAAPSGGALVYLPVYRTGEVRLAWRFKARSVRATWLYYVDALTGEILFRYNDLRFACPGGTSGTVLGEVYDVDPSSSGPDAILRPLPHHKVYMFSTLQTTYAVTGADGQFCNSGTSGKVFAGLQGPYVNVAHFGRSSLHYDNGGGQWFTAATPLASPSPYPAGSRFPNSVVYSVDINAATPPSPPFSAGALAVKAVANFDFFRVGAQTPEGDIADDDQVHVFNSEGQPLASYLGSRGPFKTAAVQGCLACDQAANRPPMRLQLRANQSGEQLGFRVNVSSYLVLTSNPTTAANPSNITWRSSDTADGTRDEINIFYHMNLMHDYFISDVDKSSMVWISSPVVAMAHFGPGLANAFFNPDHNNFGIGDAAGGIALDATVVRHEYVHYVVDKIFPTFNFGQHGAVSEALADYFAASSLNVPSIGKFVAGSFGSESSLRELACNPAPGGQPPCRVFPSDWFGEIHDDSQPLSQALWELRADLRAALGTANGTSCADNLAFKALFFFPDSFQEFLDAMLLVDSQGAVGVCGGQNAQRAAILNRFNNHMSLATLADAYEPNDGTESAADITTTSIVTAALYPAADQDYYAFASGPGTVRAALELPAATSASYFAYRLVLLDKRLVEVADATPALDVNPTLSGYCPLDDCQTTKSQAVLQYDNPSASQFFLLVAAAPTDTYSTSRTNSTRPYRLQLFAPRAGALSGRIVNAVFDGDRIDFAVNVSSFVHQDLSFSYAQLRDHNMTVVANTRTDVAGGFLAVDGAVPLFSGDGRITGRLKLQSSGSGQRFSQRYPSLGNVYLEVYAINRLQDGKNNDVDATTIGRPQSMGYSQSLSLTAAETKLTAFNNVFNPAMGQRATFKYETLEPGRLRLQLFTRSGALVATLVDGDVPAGKGAVDWTGRNSAGGVVASGIYLLRLEGPGGLNQVQKVIVVK